MTTAISTITMTAFLFLTFAATAQQVKPTGDLIAKRAMHQMQPLPNGKALIFGGQTTNATFQPQLHVASETYDPATGTWGATANLNTARRNFASVVLPNRKILAIGGSNASDQTMKSVEEYNPATGAWTLKGNLNNARQKIDAIVMTNGKILVMGGDLDSYESSADSGATWTLHEFPAMTYRFPESPALINLNDGRVLCVGNQAGQYPNWAITISPSLAHDTTANPLADDHPNAGLAKLTDGKILITGGMASGKCEIFNPGNNSISSTGSFNTSHIDCPLMKLSDGRIAVFNVGNTIQDIILEIYNPTTGVWSYATGHKFTGLSAYRVASLGNGKWLIAGGTESMGVASTGSVKSFVFDENASTGITERDEVHKSIDLYPNPASDFVTVSHASNGSTLTITDITGKVVHRSAASDEHTYISTVDFRNGIYFIQMKENGNVVRKKFVVRR